MAIKTLAGLVDTTVLSDKAYVACIKAGIELLITQDNEIAAEIKRALIVKSPRRKAKQSRLA